MPLSLPPPLLALAVPADDLLAALDADDRADAELPAEAAAVDRRGRADDMIG